MAIRIADIEAPKPREKDRGPTRGIEPIGPLKRGRKPDATSERQTKPWVGLKISERTYYRLRKKGDL